MSNKRTPEQIIGGDRLTKLSYEGYQVVSNTSIIAQAEKIARLRDALEPFAMTAELDIGDDESDGDWFQIMERHNIAARLTVGHLRRASAVLTEDICNRVSEIDTLFRQVNWLKNRVAMLQLPRGTDIDKWLSEFEDSPFYVDGSKGGDA